MLDSADVEAGAGRQPLCAGASAIGAGGSLDHQWLARKYHHSILLDAAALAHRIH